MPKKKLPVSMESGGFRLLDTDEVFVQTVTGAYRKRKGKPILEVD